MNPAGRGWPRRANTPPKCVETKAHRLKRVIGDGGGAEPRRHGGGGARWGGAGSDALWCKQPTFGVQQWVIEAPISSFQ